MYIFYQVLFSYNPYFHKLKLRGLVKKCYIMGFPPLTYTLPIFLGKGWYFSELFYFKN